MESVKKSACVFFSSPHRDGYTANLLNIFMNNAIDYKFDIINCYKEKILPCVDCGYCKMYGSCKFNDMNNIDMHLKTSDLLIFASPVYNFSFPSPLKAILDRMQYCFSARFSLDIRPPIKKKKKAILIASCGSDDEIGFRIMELQLKRIFTIINCELVGSILLSDTDKIRDFEKEPVENKVKEIISKL